MKLNACIHVYKNHWNYGEKNWLEFQQFIPDKKLKKKTLTPGISIKHIINSKIVWHKRSNKQ